MNRQARPSATPTIDEVVHFDSVVEAEAALATFFADYNHRPALLGIGSLVSADRFYGRCPEVVAEMDAVSRRRQGALALQLDRRLFVEPPAASERVITPRPHTRPPPSSVLSCRHRPDQPMTTSVRLHRRTCAFERQDVENYDS